MKEITTVTYRDRRGIFENHDGLQGRPSWSPWETTTVSLGDRRGLSPVVVLHATTVSPGEWPSW
ncbi:hypothetical protein TIFTF001_050425 [Ficus carica]|uniref:Uncharacterized protein n=1 Tax=Ficus carica TaxID=3494 RepID=A0AA88D4F2_FICCA|nr:hypothetical protein TIFTF001_050425 [Ficus carica]